MTLEEAVAKVVEKHGGIRATERAIGIDKSFLSRLMRGEKTNPSDETLAKLGLRAVPRYERVKENGNG
jgi:transcriptional regulator with XRE-family HTH domain